MTQGDPTTPLQGPIERPLGPCRLLRLLGRGGMGSVYLAEMAEARGDLPVGARVAVKVLRAELVESERQIERFRREAQLGMRIRHPAVVRTLDFGSLAGSGEASVYFILEYVEGRTLHALLTDMGTLPEALLRHVGAEVAAALGAVHAQGAVHRDVKPANILITPDHRVKLMDLGIARLMDADARLTATGSFIGTLAYSSPEQLRPGGIGPAADLYSLGVVLFEAATGSPPFASDDVLELMQMHQWRVPPRVDAINPRLSRGLADLVSRLLEKEPHSRPANADSVARALEGAGPVSSRERPANVHSSRRSIAGQAGRRVPVIGRDQELERLRSAHEGALQGRAQAVIVTGEPGVGKTRLVEEFVERVEHADPATVVLRSAHVAGAAGGWLAPYAEALLDRLGEDGLAERLGELLRIAPGIAQSLAALLQFRQVPAGAEPLALDAVHALMGRLLEAIATGATVVWIIEDIDRAPQAARDLVATLVRAGDGLPVLFIVTATGASGEDAPLLERLSGTTRLQLPRLSRDATLELIAAASGSEEMVAEMGRSIADGTRGNPLLVLEVVAEIQRGGGPGQSAESAGHRADPMMVIGLHGRPTVPVAVREVLAARLRALAVDERRLLDVAAVQGQSFDPDLVARVHGLQRLHVLQALADVERRTGIVVGTGKAFEFDGGLLHAAVRDGLPPLLRAEYHGLLADAFAVRCRLDTMSPDDVPAEVSAFLSRHWLASHEPSRAEPHVLPALRHLEARHDHEDAVEVSTLALDLLSGASPAWRCDVLLARAASLTVLGRRDAEREAAEAAVAAARDAGDAARTARARVALGRLFVVTGEYVAAREVLEACARDAARSADPPSEIDAIGLLAIVEANAGRLGLACELHEQSVRLSVMAGDARRTARAARNVGAIMLRQGRRQEAREVFSRHAESCERLGDLQLAASMTGALALLHLEEGDDTRAREGLERQLELSASIADRAQEGIACVNLASLFMHVGRYDLARPRLDRALALARATGDKRAEATIGGNLGELAWREGRLDEAARRLEECLATTQRLGLRRVAAHVLTDMARVALARDDEDQALELAEAALAGHREVGDRRGEAEATLLLGRARSARGDRELARELVGEAAEIGRTQGYDDVAALALAWACLLGSGDARDVVAGPRLTLAARADVHLVLHAATGSAEHRAAARDVLGRLGAHLPPADFAAFLAVHDRPPAAPPSD